MHSILYWSFKYIIYTLHLCFSQDIAKLGKVYTKVDSCFQKSHEELEKLHTSTGKSKRLKFDGVLSEKKYIPLAKIFYTEDLSNFTSSSLCENPPNY